MYNKKIFKDKNQIVLDGKHLYLPLYVTYNKHEQK